ncbi:MAG: hypothetical protein JSV88_25935 [Candidatus Aminicenantes bacterium]|nr:MAG: hypothetical protein JSV88_25935 [Candidatus Aminicenantes bacterium]
MNKRIYFDACSLGSLYRKRNSFELKRITNKFEVCLSLLNIFELLVYKNVVLRDKLLKFYNKLNNKNYLPLDFPLDLLKKFYLGYKSGQKNVNWGNSEIGETSLAYLENPTAIKANEINSVEKYLEDTKKFFRIAGESSRKRPFVKEMFKNKNEPKNIGEFLELALNSDSILTELFEETIQFLGVKDYKKEEGIFFIKKVEPWLFFWGAYFGGIYNQTFKREYNPNPDIIDISQAIYLGACDYFITDDIALFSLLENLNKLDFVKKKRIILRSEEFLKTLY